LRENQDGKSGTHLHGATSAGRVVGDLVTHDLHDVVTVGDETERQCGGKNSQLPDRNRCLGLSGVTGGPGRVDDSPGTDGVTDIVGTVSERSSAGGENLDERVGVLNLVGVLLSVAVDALHTSALGGSVNTSLGSVDVVVDTVQGTDHNHSRDALEGDQHVLLLVNFTRADFVLVEVAHGPGEETSLRTELGMETLLALGDEIFVAKLGVLGNDNALLSILRSSNDTVVRVTKRAGLDVVILLNDSVVADVGTFDTLGGRAAEEEWTLDGMVPADGLIALDNNGVEVGHEEEEREQSETNTAGDGDGSNKPRGLLVQSEVGRSLVDYGERADGTSNQEEEGGSPDGPRDGVLAEMDSELDQHEDDGTEAGRGGGSHSETSEDGTETLALVPAPLNVLSTSNSDTNTSDRRDERVGGRNVSGVLGAPHDPDGGTSEGAGESKHLDAGVTLEGVGGDDSVLDGVGSTGTNSDGTNHLEDGTENHGLAVRDRTRRD